MQTSIPVPESDPEPQTCAWCSEPAVTTLQVEKPRYGKSANGTRVLKRRAWKMPACASHAQSVQVVDPRDAKDPD